MSAEQTDKVLGYLKNYVAPIIVGLISVVIAWNTMYYQIERNTEEIVRLDKRLIFVEQCSYDTANRLTRIETSIDHITKIIDRQYNNR